MVQQVLASAQEVQEWPDEMSDNARQQVILGDARCLYWALSAVEGQSGQVAADKVCRALTERGKSTASGVAIGAAGQAGRRGAAMGAVPGQSLYWRDMGRGV